MNKYGRRRITTSGMLAACCISMTLWGCGAEEKKPDELVIEPILSEETDQTPPEEDIQTVFEAADSEDTQTDIETDPEDMQAASEESPETVSDSQTLYEQFLSNSISATVASDYSEGDYAEQILDKNTALTLTELEDRVSAYFFDPEYMDKTSCDRIQYAYVDCPDSSDETDRNLLVKFVGLNIYSQDDDSYAVFILNENNGQLYITGSYQCWARSETVAYANGILWNSGSSGAGDHGTDLSAILSNGKPASIYNARILSGQWTSSVNGSLYSEVFGDNTGHSLCVSIYTIGSEKYYQYDMTYCEEEEIPLCETYINRCRDEGDIKWVSEEEIETAIQNQCTAVGIDYSIIDQREETKWNDLS